MMQWTKTIVLLISVLGMSAALADRKTGVQQFEVFSALRGEAFPVTIWYPTNDTGEPTLVGQNRIFKGTASQSGVRPAEGRFPFVLMSHGSGSSASGLAWLATELAKSGMVVAAPNHLGTTSGDSTPVDTPKLWQRTSDLSLVLDYVKTNPLWRDKIDTERVGVLGFSLGGAAAMELVGARANLDKYIQYCDQYPKMADCDWFASTTGYVDGQAVEMAPFDLSMTDKTKFEQSNLDTRVKNAVLIDPSLVQAFDLTSLQQIQIPMHFISMGDADSIPVSVVASDLVGSVQNGYLDYISESHHYSFLPECVSGAADFLRRIQERDPLCDEVGQRSRASIHGELITKILGFFKEDFSL